MRNSDYFRVLSEHIQSNPMKLGEAESILALLYESYIDLQGYDNEKIKADFNELYSPINGMPIWEMDKIIYQVCTLCRDHEKAGFIEGIKVGVGLAQELTTR